MKKAGVVILYHPDSQVRDRIMSYLPFLDLLFIIDNTERSTNPFNDFTGLDVFTVRFFQDGENKGIAERLNFAAALALENGCEWLLTMDQDSSFEDGSVPSYFNCIASYPEIDRTAMFGVSFLEKINSSRCISKKTSQLITSGSVVNLKLFPDIGPFDEALFIDRVDHEFCLRAQDKGFDIVLFENIFMNHSLGNSIDGYAIGQLRKKRMNLHNPVRLYYMTRNYFYLRSKYKGKHNDYFLALRKEMIVRIKNNLLYGKQKFSLIGYLLKAYKDFKKGRLGKIHN